MNFFSTYFLHLLSSSTYFLHLLSLSLILLPYALGAEVKRVTWSLPADWEAGVEYGATDGRLVIRGNDFGYPSEPVGAPALPFLPVTLPVPSGATYSNCTVVATWAAVEYGTTHEALRPAVIQEPQEIGEEAADTPEDAQYFGAARYPANPETVVGIETSAGESTIRAWVTPYRWNGQTKKLEKLVSLTLTFTYIAPRTAKKLKAASADNYTGLFLIISPSQYKDMWGEYLTYRRSTHPQIEFEVVNADTIYADYSGVDDAQCIHKYLEYRYANRGGRTMYVILGGGCKKTSDTYNRATMIPLRMTATRNRLYYPSDLYYACMEKPTGDGEVWDPNGDGIFLGYKNSSGGYTSDTRAQVDIMPDIAVFRVPVRPSFTHEGKTVAAQAQISGFVAKLQRAEADDFAGRHNSGLAGLKVFAQKYHGNTEDWMTQERTFYDGMVNIWSGSHADPTYDFEYFTRTAHVNWWFMNRPLNNFYASTEYNVSAIPNNNMEFYVIEAHGAPSGAGPLSNTQMWKTTALQKIACWNLPCSTGKIDDDRLTAPEAMILNPDGGALVSYNNAREGYGIANDWNSLSALMERENRRAYMANGLVNRTSGEAFIEGHRTFLNCVGGLQISATAIACYIETMAFGDPLVKLSDVTDNADLPATIGGAFYREVTTTNKSLAVSAKSSVVKMTVRDLGGETFTVSGQEFKAYKGMAVYGGGGRLVWSAPGGVGGAGLAFDTKTDLEISATGSTYFGPVFSNVRNVLVSGSNATLDFDKTGKTRDFASLAFTGTGPNYIRSREGGLFSASFTIPVTGGTLVLQTQNIGGGGAASDTTHPLFALTNATLRIDNNPNWGTEFLNRPVWMNNATLSSNYGKVGFGANVDNPPGFDVWVFGDKGSVIGGSQDIEVNGEFRVHCEGGARLAATVPFVKAARTGSLTKLGTGTLTLSGTSTIAGGIRVKEGKVIAGGVAGDVLGTGEVTVESGATLELTAVPLTTITKLTVKSGATLILPGAETTASFYLLDPTKGSVNIESGAMVYNACDLDTPLTGSMTGEGYYIDTSSFLNWVDADGTWSTAADDANWRNKSGVATAFANGDSVQFPDYGAKTLALAVNGSLAPGYMNFNNHRTTYDFTKGGTTSEINVNTVYTVGETRIAPDLKVNKMGVTGGKAIVGNVVAPELFVSPGAALDITGTLSPQAYITKVTLQVTQMKGAWYDYSFLGAGSGYHFAGFALGELELVNVDGRVLPPVGSKISSSNGNSATVTAVNDGTITVSGTTAMANLFNGSAGSSSDRWGNISSENNDLKAKSATPTYTLTIEFSSPVKMISRYRFGLADYNLRNPESWKLSVVEKTSGGTYTVSTQSGVSLGGTNCYTGYYGCSGIDDCEGAGTFSVSQGAKLYLDGTMNVKPTIAAGATLAVTNRECMTLNKGWTLGGTVNLDVSEAGKMGWTKVISGASLTAVDVYRFALATDRAVAKVQDGDLWVATEGIVEAPYTRQVGGTCDWNSADWFANGTRFDKTFNEVITHANGDLVLDVTNETTMTIGCGVTVGAIYVTNTTGNAASLHLKGERTDVLTTLLDFSGFNGPVTWSPDLNGANVIAGMNRVILLNGNGDTLNVSSNGYVSTVGTFSTWNSAQESRIHFANSPRALNMSQMPARGVLSFDGMELQDGSGAFQKSEITYLVEDGQSLTLKETGSMQARCLSSFDIRGGSVTVNPNGAWWFGQNGVTSYEQTGGALTCNATGTTVGDSGSGIVFGYTGEASFMLEVNVNGGQFIVPNSILNIWNPTTISVASNALVKAKGIGARSGINGILTLGSGTTFEVGSVGMTSSVTYELNGGTIAGYEKGAEISGKVTLGGSGTFAAAAGVTLNVNGTIAADGATLTIGTTNYTGMVKLTAIPSGITNLVVDAGTMHLGLCRPVTKTLGASDGAIAITLSNAQIRNAKTTSVKIIKATTVPKGGVLVYSAKGDLQTETVAAIENGFLTVKTTHDNMFKTETGLKWGNIGDADNRVATKADQAGFYGNAKTWTLNLTNTVNMSASTIGPNGRFTITSMRFFGRKNNDKAAPTSVTLKQGSVTAVSTSVKNTAAGGTLYVTGGSSQTYGLNVFTFDDAVAFDPSQNITMTFEPSGSEIGYGMMLPANTLFYHTFSSGNFSPIIEITGDWTYESDEPATDDASSDSVSINIIGGNASGRTGRTIASGFAGKYPVAVDGWNQLADHSLNIPFSEYTDNLFEVRFDGSIRPSPVSATLSGRCTYTSGLSAANADAELAFGYIDDGGSGARIVVENIPYSRYDVYVYMGTDVADKPSGAFGPVCVTSGNFTTNYPAANTAWGSANATHGTVELVEGLNCFRIAGLCGSSVSVNGSTKDTPSGTRCGIAGVQIVNTGVRQEVYIAGDGGTIAVNPTNVMEYVVSAEGVKPSITINGAGEYVIVVPPTVTNVVGVAAGNIRVRHGEHDITDAFRKQGSAEEGFNLRLDAKGKVTIGAETIRVTPELAAVAGDEDVAGQPFAVTDMKAAVGVKSIPGLTYRLMRGTEIGTYAYEADAKQADAARVTLKDGEKPAGKAFYIIECGILFRATDKEEK